MKGQVLHYDDASGVGQISGADGIRYNFTRADLKRLVPVSAGTEVDFDFDGRTAKDIYVVSQAQTAAPGQAGAYAGPVEADLGMFGYFRRAITSYYFNFSGRARRKEYWSFIVVPLIIYLVGMAVFGGIYASVGPNAAPSDGAAYAAGALAIVLGLFGLAIIVPTLAMYVRRLHDVGQTGWLVLVVILISFIPFVGLVAFIVLGCIDSQRAANQYGPPPKAFYG